MPSEAVINFIVGVGIGLPLGYLAYRLRYLDLKAAVTSVIFSGLYLMGGIGIYIASLAFFFSSSLITKFHYSSKQSKGAAEREEGRKASQVIGAGFIAALLASLYGVLPVYQERILLSALAVLAASNADTWAAEIGALYRGLPRLITRPWLKVEPGTSGGVTPLGALGSLLGSILIGVVALVEAQLGILKINQACVPLVVVLGWLGEILDSLVGATLQIKYYCPRCRAITDKAVHSCGEKTYPIGGLRVVTNEATNVIATGLTGLLAFLIAC